MELWQVDILPKIHVLPKQINTMNKDKIFEKMIDEMPYQFPKSIQPYVYEAMDIYAKDMAMRFVVFQLGYTFNWGKARWENNLEHDVEYTHEELFNKFIFECG
mgnify:CR=1 FL=1